MRAWKQDLPPETPVLTVSTSQKAWDKPKIDFLFESILVSCKDDVSKARLLAASSVESGAWFKFPPWG